MIYSVSRRADTHKNHCEDDHYTFENEKVVIAAVFDGCSTGKNSHVASGLLRKCLEVAVEVYTPTLSTRDNMLNILMSNASLNFKSVALLLGLENLEALSTFGLAIYNKETKKLLYKFLGDGTIFFRKALLSTFSMDTIHFPNNAPDYLGHHLNKSVADLLRWVEDKPFVEEGSVAEFSLCTDGIDAIRQVTDKGILQDPVVYLVANDTLKQSTAMLSRKLNILSKSCAFDDDITIVRYIP